MIWFLVKLQKYCNCESHLFVENVKQDTESTDREIGKKLFHRIHNQIWVAPTFGLLLLCETLKSLNRLASNHKHLEVDLALGLHLDVSAATQDEDWYTHREDLSKRYEDET